MAKGDEFTYLLSLESVHDGVAHYDRIVNNEVVAPSLNISVMVWDELAKPGFITMIIKETK